MKQISVLIALVLLSIAVAHSGGEIRNVMMRTKVIQLAVQGLAGDPGKVKWYEMELIEEVIKFSSGEEE